MAPFSARNASQLAGGFMPMVRNNSMALTQAGIGLLSGPTASQQAALGAQGFMQGRQTNQTAKWLQTIDPMLAQAVSRGALPIADAVKLAYGQKLKAQTPESTSAIKEYQFAKQQGYGGTFQEWISQNGGGSGGTRWSTQPQLFQDQNGDYRYGTFSSQGDFKPIDTGDYNPVNPYDMNFQRASGSAAGKSYGEGVNTAPQDVAKSLQTAKQIDELIANPGFDSIYGAFDQFRPSWTMSGEGRDALARYKQLQGKAFLEAYAMLKGGGQITEIEGIKAEAAMARLDRAQDEATAKQALMDFRDAITEGARKLEQRYGLKTNLPANGNANSNGASPSLQDYRNRYGLE